MNTYSKRRRTILSLVLSVALVMAYMVAPVGSAMNVYADEGPFVSFDDRAEEEGLCGTIEITDEGFSPLAIPFMYYGAGEQSAEIDKYVKFEIIAGAEFSCEIADDDTYISEEGGRMLLIIPGEDLEPSIYGGELRVYFDETGSGNFEESSQQFDISIDVQEQQAVSFDVNWDEEYDLEREVGYDAEDFEEYFFLNIGACDPEYEGRPISDFIKFDFSGEDADAFTISGFEGAATLSSEENSSQEIYIVPVEGLEAGYYCANLGVYYDLTGQGNFGEYPDREVLVSFHVEAQPAYRAEFVCDKEVMEFLLPEGYAPEDAAATGMDVAISNTGTETFVINEDDLSLCAGAEDQEGVPFELIQETLHYPITLAPGESVKVAEIQVAEGLSAGKYLAELNLENLDYDIYANQPLQLMVLKNGPELMLDTKGFDFGIYQPGFSFDPRDAETACVINSGNVPLVITDIVKPEEGPFATPEYIGDEDVLRSGEEMHFVIALDDESEYASLNGDYNTVYKVYASEVDEDGKVIEGGHEVELEVPVHVEISDATYTVTVKNTGHGKDVVVKDVLKGTNISEAANEGFAEQYSDPYEKGYDFVGLGPKPLSAYSDWETFEKDRMEFQEQVVTGDTTVYALWMPTVGDAVNVTVKVPKAGDAAEEEYLEAKSSNSKYEAAVWWRTEYDEPVDTFEEGGKYYAAVELWPTAGFPYTVPSYHEYGSWNFTVNGSKDKQFAGNGPGWVEVRVPFYVHTSGWHKDDGEWRYYANGAMLTNGWAKDSAGWCYMDGSGKMTRNKWIRDKGEWYFLKSNGYMAANEWAKDSSGWCYMDGSGKVTKSQWIKDKGEWYYLKANGYMAANEWAKDSGGWMWMNGSGKITKNQWIKDKGEWYYLKANGYMAANEWAKDSGGWMYMNASGKITKSQWIKSGGSWYYLKANGYMATGTQQIGGKTYHFSTSGKWIN